MKKVRKRNKKSAKENICFSWRKVTQKCDEKVDYSVWRLNVTLVAEES